MMGTEAVSETSIIFNQLTRLTAREKLINFYLPSRNLNRYHYTQLLSWYRSTDTHNEYIHQCPAFHMALSTVTPILSFCY